MSGYGTGQSQEQVAAMVASMLPAPAAATPLPTALDSGKGMSPRYALEDHTHATHVQRTTMTTTSDGTATWTFARPIVCAVGKVPAISYMVEDTGSPVVVQVITRAFTSDGTTDTHTAITVKAQRSRTLPAVLVTLTTLINFDVFGTIANGVKVNLWAADPTQ